MDTSSGRVEVLPKSTWQHLFKNELLLRVLNTSSKLGQVNGRWHLRPRGTSQLFVEVGSDLRD
jgi:hypothetical protein